MGVFSIYVFIRADPSTTTLFIQSVSVTHLCLIPFSQRQKTLGCCCDLFKSTQL